MFLRRKKEIDFPTPITEANVPSTTRCTSEHDDDHKDPADPQRSLGLLGHHGSQRDRRRRPGPRLGDRLPPRCRSDRGRAGRCPRLGRHFADEVANGLWRGEPIESAIDAAISRWMVWRIDRRTEREDGIPRGLPYLTGWVTHFQILDETQA